MVLLLQVAGTPSDYLESDLVVGISKVGKTKAEAGSRN